MHLFMFKPDKNVHVKLIVLSLCNNIAFKIRVFTS